MPKLKLYAHVFHLFILYVYFCPASLKSEIIHNNSIIFQSALSHFYHFHLAKIKKSFIMFQSFSLNIIVYNY